MVSSRYGGSAKRSEDAQEHEHPDNEDCSGQQDVLDLTQDPATIFPVIDGSRPNPGYAKDTGRAPSGWPRAGPK